MSSDHTIFVRYDGTKAIVAFCGLGVVFVILGTLSWLIRLTGYVPSADAGLMPWYMHPNAILVGLAVGAMCLTTGIALFFVFRTNLSAALEFSPDRISTCWRFPKESMTWSEISRVEFSEHGLRLFDSAGAARIALPIFLLDTGPEALQQLIDRYRRGQASRNAPGGSRTGFGRRGA